MIADLASLASAFLCFYAGWRCGRGYQIEKSRAIVRKLERRHLDL